MGRALVLIAPAGGSPIENFKPFTPDIDRTAACSAANPGCQSWPCTRESLHTTGMPWLQRPAKSPLPGPAACSPACLQRLLATMATTPGPLGAAAQRLPRLADCALLAVLAAMLACTGASATAGTWASCGGSKACPCGTADCNHQWPKTRCNDMDVCIRQDSSWWRCEPRSAACRQSVATWSSCGGKDWCSGAGRKECDAPWEGSCCNAGDVCVRQSERWWRCEPADYFASRTVCYYTAPRWSSCGGKSYCPAGTSNCDAPWPGSCCQRGETCKRVDATFWRCEPDGGPTPDQPPRGSPPPRLAAWGPRLVNPDTGNTVVINGLNWFGYNVARTMVDGLNVGDSDVSADFNSIVYQLKMLGYNTVRLPFRWRDLDAVPKDYTWGSCWQMSREDLRRRLMEPGTWTNKPLPPNRAAMGHKRAGGCNTNVPNGSSSTYERLLWTLQVFVSQGMYVILDYQPMGSEQQPLDVGEFTCKWATLWSKVVALPNWSSDLRGRIFVDVMNEPDSMQIKWESVGGRPGAHQLYIGTMDAIHAITPDGVLYVVEGTGQTGFGLNWGNGFVTDPTIIKQYGLSDPNPFFRELLTKPYASQVVFTPHVYPPTVTQATFLGTALWSQSHLSFGYLNNQGYCAGGKCTRFPVLIGETGSFMTDARDKQWMQDFADFVNAGGGASAYTYTPTSGWLWWAFNENSMDTGGLVYDRWQQLDWNKIRFMVQRFGLTPWYLDRFTY